MLIYLIKYIMIIIMLNESAGSVGCMQGSSDEIDISYRERGFLAGSITH